MSTLDRRSDAPTMDIWRRNFATDVHFDGPDSPSTTKAITGKTYQGTSLDPVYVVQRLTQEFGPIGEGWGIEVEHEQFLEGETYFNDKGQPIGTELLHLVRCRLWWKRPEGEKNSFVCCGGTQARYRSSKGRWMCDEDVYKKSLTDAMTKGAAWLGIGADIHAGKWDNSKYRDERAQDEKRRHEGIQAEEKVAVLEQGLANCEDAGALRAYLAQERLQHWIGVQKRNHPAVHAKVEALIDAARARFAGPEEGEPEALLLQQDDPPAAPDEFPGDIPSSAEASPYAYVNSKGEVEDYCTLARWRSEWSVRIHSVANANKPAKERHGILGGMLDRNRATLNEIHALDEGHATEVTRIWRRIAEAQGALRELDADSTAKPGEAAHV